MDEVQQAIQQRLGLWQLTDEASELERRISQASSSAPGQSSPTPVAGDDPARLLAEGQRSLEEARAAQAEVEGLQNKITQAEASIAAIEEEQARRQRQLIILGVVVAVVLLIVLTILFSG